MILILISKHCLSGVEYRKVYDGPTDEQGGLHWCAKLIGAPQRESVEEDSDEHDEVRNNHAHVCMYRQRGSDAGFVHYYINQGYYDVYSVYRDDKIIIKLAE